MNKENKKEDKNEIIEKILLTHIEKTEKLSGNGNVTYCILDFYIEIGKSVDDLEPSQMSFELFINDKENKNEKINWLYEVLKSQWISYLFKLGITEKNKDLLLKIIDNYNLLSSEVNYIEETVVKTWKENKGSFDYVKK